MFPLHHAPTTLSCHHITLPRPHVPTASRYLVEDSEGEIDADWSGADDADFLRRERGGRCLDLAQQTSGRGQRFTHQVLML